MKMYILVKDNISSGHAILAASHASLAAFLKFKDSVEIREWLAGPFYKVVCKVNEKEFSKAKLFDDSVIITESSLENSEVAIAFKPREEWPKPFKFYKLFK